MEIEIMGIFINKMFLAMAASLIAACYCGIRLKRSGESVASIVPRVILHIFLATIVGIIFLSNIEAIK
jgi:hypothetical protein